MREDDVWRQVVEKVREPRRDVGEMEAAGLIRNAKCQLRGPGASGNLQGALELVPAKGGVLATGCDPGAPRVSQVPRGTVRDVNERQVRTQRQAPSRPDHLIVRVGDDYGDPARHRGAGAERVEQCGG
jgi:hypothetical protein